MTTKYENGILSFMEEQNEKVFCAMGTIFGDGDRYVKLMTEEEVRRMDSDNWSIPLEKMKVGDTAYYCYWYKGKANVLTRLA